MSSTIVRIRVPIRVFDTDFEFELCRQEIELGNHGSVRYFWMDSSSFRNLRHSEANQLELQSVLNHQCQLMLHTNDGLDRENLVLFLLAVCYGLTSDKRASKNVYRDAFLAPRRSGRRVRDQATITQPAFDPKLAHDMVSIKSELDKLLAQERCSDEDASMMKSAFDYIVKEGLDDIERDGLWDRATVFCRMMEDWLDRNRRRGGIGWRRSQLNLFEHEFKVSFYTCVANAWISIIPKLRESYGLCKLGERFMRFWHSHSSADIGPDGQPMAPVFGGHMLSMHPLSDFFMRHPERMQIAGDFLNSPDYERLVSKGIQGKTYWNLVAAIVASATEYRLADESERDSRVLKQNPPRQVEEKPIGSEDIDKNEILNRFAEAKGWRCETCISPMIYSQRNRSKKDGSKSVRFKCEKCNQYLNQPLDEVKFTEWIRQSNNGEREPDC